MSEEMLQPTQGEVIIYQAEDGKTKGNTAQLQNKTARIARRSRIMKIVCG